MNKVMITGTIEHAPIELVNKSIMHVRLQNRQVITVFYDHKVINTLLNVGDEVLLTGHIKGSIAEGINSSEIFIDQIEFVNNAIASA